MVGRKSGGAPPVLCCCSMRGCKSAEIFGCDVFTQNELVPPGSDEGLAPSLPTGGAGSDRLCEKA